MENINALLETNTEFGYGYGNGSGYGYGNGRSYGYGNGRGYGYGRGYGGIVSINGHIIHDIDGVQTIITNIQHNIAKGWIVNGDLTQTPCYIAKVNGYFGHGETVRDAVSAAEEKAFEDIDTETAIELFLQEFPDGEKKYPAQDFYVWHHRLTGSCEMGRQAFVRDHGIDLEHDEFTIQEFINFTKNAYGGEIIQQLNRQYGVNNNG